MPTVMTHGIFAVALGHVFKNSALPRRFWTLAIVCSILPDLDVVGFKFGVQYADLWGHRGITHSLVFALFTAGLVVLLFFRQSEFRPLRMRLVVFYFLVTASHGLFDAMTNGGLGIAFFAPFDNARYFLPFQPIEVSPIGIRNFFTQRSADVLISEAKWLLLPSGIVFLLASTIRIILKKRSIIRN